MPFSASSLRASGRLALPLGPIDTGQSLSSFTSGKTPLQRQKNHSGS